MSSDPHPFLEDLEKGGVGRTTKISSDPLVDLMKKRDGVKAEEGLEKGGATGAGLKEEEEDGLLVRFKVMCVKALLDLIPVVYFLGVIIAIVSLYKQSETGWYPWPIIAAVLLACSVAMFWRFRQLKDAYTRRTSRRANNHLATTLLVASKE